MRVRMDTMEVTVRRGCGWGLVLTYARRGAATDKLEDDVSNGCEHSKLPAHLTTRSGQGGEGEGTEGD